MVQGQPLTLGREATAALFGKAPLRSYCAARAGDGTNLRRRWGRSLRFTLSRYLSRYPLFGSLFVDAESPPVPVPIGVGPRFSQIDLTYGSL